MFMSFIGPHGVSNVGNTKAGGVGLPHRGLVLRPPPRCLLQHLSSVFVAIFAVSPVYYIPGE